MRKVSFVIIAFISLCACEEKVSIYEYYELENKFEAAERQHEELSGKYQLLKEQEAELSNTIAELNETYNEHQSSIEYAKTKVEALIQDYNKLIYGHWALEYSDIANDAHDVKSALEGSKYIMRVRTKGGIRY